MVYTKKLSVGIVGAGYIVNFAHLPALKSIPEVNLTAICDQDITRAKKMSEAYNIPKYYSDVSEMLNSERMDLVDICTTPDSHKDILLKVIEKNINCIVEKPLTLTSVDADCVIEATKQANVSVHVIFNYSFVPGIIKAKALVDKGKIGEIRGIAINHYVPLEKRHLDPKHWCHNLPGDYFSEMGPHLAFFVPQFLGKIKYVKSIAYKNSPYTQIKLDEWRVVAAAESGGATITCSLNCPARVQFVDIFGTKGIVHVDGNYQAVVSYKSLKSSLNVLARGWAGVNDISTRIGALANTSAGVLFGKYKAETYGHRYLLKESINSIINKTSYPIELWQAREAVRLLELAFADKMQ